MEEKRENPLVAMSALGYLKYGDMNAQRFHSWETMRKAKNNIVGLYDANGVWRTTHDEIASAATSYFCELFTYSSLTHVEDVLDCVPTRVFKEMNDMLCRPYSREKVDYALKQMHPHQILTQME